MKISQNDIPQIKVNGFDLTLAGGLDALAGHNSSLLSYGIRVGDKITFPEDAASIHVATYPTRKPSGDAEADKAIPLAKGIYVQRNGNIDFFNPGCLAVRNQFNEPFNYVDDNNVVVTPEFNKQMCNMTDTPARLTHLLGKTITCTAVVTIKQKKFQSEELQDKRVAVIEYVD